MFDPEGMGAFAIRALRHPRILKQINLLESLKSEQIIRRHRTSLLDFLCVTTKRPVNEVETAIREVDCLKQELRRYPARDCLFGLTRLLEPYNVFETGVAGGYGSAHVLAAMRLNGCGHLTSIDSAEYFDPRYFDLPPHFPIGDMVPAGLRERWDLFKGGAEYELPRLLNGHQELDMFIHDSLHTRENMLFELRIAWKHLRPGGVIVCHDIWQPWIDFANEVVRPYTVYQFYGALVK